MQRSKAGFFRAHPLLGGLPPRERKRLATAAQLITVPRRRHLWYQGDLADRLYLVRSGVVRISRAHGRQRELTVDYLGRGELVGESEVLLPGPRRVTHGVAHEETTAFAVDADTLLALADSSAALSARLARLASVRRARLERRMDGLVFLTVRQRLASALIELAEDFGVRDSRGIIVNLKLTHRELAAWIGSTRETAGNTIHQLRREGLLESDGKRVVLLDAAALRAVSEGGLT